MPNGKISPKRAARMLGKHPNSVYSWCRAAEAGQPTKLRLVERDPRNRYFRISIEEVQVLRQQTKAEVLFSYPSDDCEDDED